VLECHAQGTGAQEYRPFAADHNQAARRGGGDYRNIVLAPSVQEAADVDLSFELAEKYRTICMMIMDDCIVR
jgi:pyruvate/2-oxoacid:ferredoxin oxidoreductase alpha subunit